jgi:hypothetical protein
LVLAVDVFLQNIALGDVFQIFLGVAGLGAPVSPSAPAASYDYNREQSWKNFVNADGSIRSTPRTRWDF